MEAAAGRVSDLHRSEHCSLDAVDNHNLDGSMMWLYWLAFLSVAAVVIAGTLMALRWFGFVIDEDPSEEPSSSSSPYCSPSCSACSLERSQLALGSSTRPPSTIWPDNAHK
jgi:hypothetical protein